MLMDGLNMRNLITLAIVTALAATAQVGGSEGRPPTMPTAGGTGNFAESHGFRPWLVVNGTYRKSLDENKDSSSYSHIIPALGGGISGWKAWNHKRFEGSYTGSTNEYNTASHSADWTQSHILMLGYSQQVNQRLSFGVSQIGGYTMGGYGYGSAYGVTGVPGLSGSLGFGSDGSLSSEFGNLANNGVASNELVASRTKFSLSSGGVSYMLDRRWMASAYVGAWVMRRPQQQYSQDSFQAGGSISYALTETSQMGGEYSQQKSRYVNLFGGVSSQSAMINFQTQLSSTVRMSAGGGVGMVRSQFVGPIAIDPALAALLGTGTVLQVRQTDFITPYYNVNVSKQFERGAIMIGASRGTSTGNGIVMAGIQDSGLVNYSRTLNSRISASWFASYSRLSGRVATLSVTQHVQTGGMLAVRMIHSFSLTAQAGLRYQSIAPLPRRRDLFAGLGLAWTPGSVPFIF